MSGHEVFSESLPLADLLVRSAVRHPGRIALAMPDDQLTFGELLEQSEHTARGLIACGVGPGDNVGILAPNSPEFMTAFFGAAMIGAVVVPLNVRHRDAELGYVIEHAELAAVLTTDRIAHRTNFRQLLSTVVPGLTEARQDPLLRIDVLPRLLAVVVLGGRSEPGFIGQDQFDTLAAGVEATEVHRHRSRVRVRDDALILYTSGTTAHPKGCVITNESITRASMGRAREVIPALADTADRAAWLPLPFFHIAALQSVVFSVGAGITCVTDVNLDAARALALIKKWRTELLWPGFVVAIRTLMDTPGFSAEDLRFVSVIMSGGAPSDIYRLHETFPQAAIINGSGMSEMTGFTCLSAPADSLELRATTVGKPVAGIQVRVVDPDTGEDVPDGGLGEYLVKGYSMMSGYFHDPVRTAETIDDEGWLRTGDLFRRLPSGHMVFEGRLKDMLKVGGENVPAVEVESFLCGHPSVRIAAVVGRPDDRLDEVPVAFVEAEAGMQIDEEELIEFCRTSIASFKVPRSIFVMRTEEWPVLATTKIDKNTLRKIALNG